MLNTELPYCIEDPLNADAGARPRFSRRALDCIKDFIEGLFLPEHYTRGKNHLRVAHVLRSQPLRQPRRDQRVVLRSLEQQGHDTEGFEKAPEITVVKALGAALAD